MGRVCCAPTSMGGRQEACGDIEYCRDLSISLREGRPPSTLSTCGCIKWFIVNLCAKRLLVSGVHRIEGSELYL